MTCRIYSAYRNIDEVNPRFDETEREIWANTVEALVRFGQ